MQGNAITTRLLLITMRPFVLIQSLLPRTITGALHTVTRVSMARPLQIILMSLSSTRNSRRSCYHRGLAYWNKGDYDKAITDYTEAIRLNQAKYAVAYNNRAIAYEKKGEKAKAEADFAEAKKLGYKLPQGKQNVIRLFVK